MSSLEKGTGFELKIAELFKQKGYHVTHNIKLKGKSGAEHQIDVLAQYQAPLHTSTVIIEAKSYTTNIDKDIIMKLIHIQQDLLADRAILVTTSDFTPGALLTAEQYKNLELWDRQKITSYLGEIQILDTSDGIKTTNISSIKVIPAKLSLEEVKRNATESAEKRSKGGWLSVGKVEEKVVSVEKFLYPYYDVDIEAKIRVVEKTGWFSEDNITKTVSSKTSVDGNTGAIIDVTSNGISYIYSFLSNLSEDEIRLLYYVSRVKDFDKRSLSAIGWSTGKISNIVNSLAGKGRIEQTQTRPVVYKSVNPYPSDPSIFVSLLEWHQILETNTDDKKINNKFTPGSIATAFDKYWIGCRIKSIDLVYYPFYGIIYERKDNSKRNEIIDGVTGFRQEYLEKIVSLPIVNS